MASKITLDNIQIKNSQGNFLDPIQFQITFSNLVPLNYPIEWKVIYFGSANEQDHDQVLQQFQIPAVDQVQTMKFEITVPAPDYTKLPREQLLCVTAMILTVSYKNQQFIRVGYYIHYQYQGDQEPDRLILIPAQNLVRNTRRTILFDKPRVTKFNIKWDSQHKNSTESQQKDIMEDESDLKQMNEEKLSTLQEKSQRSNNFLGNYQKHIQC